MVAFIPGRFFARRGDGSGNKRQAAGIEFKGGVLLLSRDRPHAAMSSLARFEQLALKHLEAAYNLAFWLVRSRPDAEDVVQDAYLRALRAFQNFHGDDMVRLTVTGEDLCPFACRKPVQSCSWFHQELFPSLCVNRGSARNVRPAMAS